MFIFLIKLCLIHHDVVFNKVMLIHHDVVSDFVAKLFYKPGSNLKYPILGKLPLLRIKNIDLFVIFLDVE